MLKQKFRLPLAECFLTATRYFSSTNTDYYSILGIKHTASQKEIKTAFYKLSKRYHPDVVGSDAKDVAAQKFHEVSQAYEILGSEENRKIYDMTRVRSTPSSSKGSYASSMRNSTREKQYTDIDIDYKDFEHFQKSTRQRQNRMNSDFPHEFFEGLGGKKREFKSEWDEESARLQTMYRDSRSAMREERELQAEISRKQAEFEARFKADPFEKMMKDRQKEYEKDSLHYYTAMFSIIYYGDHSKTFELAEIKSLSAGNVITTTTQREPSEEFYLTYMGNRLESAFYLNDLGDELDEHTVLRIVSRETSPPSSLASAQQIDDIRKFFKELQKDRNAYLLHTFTTACFDPDFVRKQIESEPNLRSDGEALHILSDYFLLSSYFDENNKAAAEWLSKHPTFVSVIHKLIGQISGAQRNPMSPSMMPQMGALLNAPMPNQSAAPLITPAQFQAAMMQAFGNLGNQPPASSSQSTPDTNMPQQYETQLTQLHEFGFLDDAQNLEALAAANGNVEVALEILVSMRENE
ncbi:unnamed protein product, partial [Mesorhabditis belari]|uniref:J domain-containing protein n=1 Tax=Mesorhabditis belari TaxID=2138241 RepID=A0AAF3FDM9_9BILA